MKLSEVKGLLNFYASLNTMEGIDTKIDLDFAIQKLTRTEQTVILSTLIDGRDEADCGHWLGKTPEEVKKIQKRALGKIARFMQ